MLSVCTPEYDSSGNVTRREMLRVGGALGLSWTALEQGRAVQAATHGGSFGRAKACIVLFLGGGPPQHETWDPKPNTAAEIRGDLDPISSSIPGLQVGELMPRLAAQAHLWSILRATRTEDNAHSASGYYMLTGRPHSPKGQESATPKEPNTWPCVGAVAGKLLPRRGALPGSVTLPEHLWNTGGFTWPGQDGGFLGRAADPWLIHCDPNEPSFVISGLGLPADVNQLRLDGRLALHTQLDQQLARQARLRDFDGYNAWTRTAIDLVGSKGPRDAFNLDLEPSAVRERYGRHRFGQSVLLARRLVEAGVSLVQVNWTRDKDGTNDSPMWDTHVKNTWYLKNRLMPPMDLACSALIEDLSDRGMLDETLVVWMGEFGRSPKINPSGGRDHWGNVFSMALAGGGIRQGIVYGESDALGREPKDGVVKPENVMATIFHCLGLGEQATIPDRAGRPQHIAGGEPIRQIL